MGAFSTCIQLQLGWRTAVESQINGLYLTSWCRRHNTDNFQGRLKNQALFKTALKFKQFSMCGRTMMRYVRIFCVCYAWIRMECERMWCEHNWHAPFTYVICESFTSMEMCEFALHAFVLYAMRMRASKGNFCVSGTVTQSWGQVLFEVLESSTSPFSYLQVQVQVFRVLGVLFQSSTSQVQVLW